MNDAERVVMDAFPGGYGAVDEKSLIEAIRALPDSSDGVHWSPSGVLASMVRRGLISREIIYSPTCQGLDAAVRP